MLKSTANFAGSMTTVPSAMSSLQGDCTVLIITANVATNIDIPIYLLAFAYYFNKAFYNNSYHKHILPIPIFCICTAQFRRD